MADVFGQLAQVFMRFTARQRLVENRAHQGAVFGKGLGEKGRSTGENCSQRAKEREANEHARKYGIPLHHTKRHHQNMRHNLSDTNALLRDRRSISPERYSTRKVHRELVEQILTNATWAPTHGMTQPWRFKAYVGEGMKQIGPRLAEWYALAAGDAFSASKHAKLVARGERVSALVVLAVVPDPTGRISLEDERMAVACAAQNMYLTCTAHGIGGFWSTPGFMKLPEVKAFAGLPEEAEVLGLFYMGYPEGGEWPKSHRKPLEYVTDWITEAE